MTDTWSPSLYLEFENERTRPARDLLAQVPLVSARKVVDVGCGPGNSTALLTRRFPTAEIVGIDSSAGMLEQAATSFPSVRFIQADADGWLPDVDTDLVFANAIYQWIPHHLELFPRIVTALPPDGVLAVQMPDNVNEPTHRLMGDVAQDPRWSGRLAHAARPPLAPARAYYDALRPVASHVELWHVVYNHALESADGIVDWVRATGLRPFLDPLGPDERAAFLAAYRDRVADAYPPLVDGRVLLRFPRFFVIAVR